MKFAKYCYNCGIREATTVDHVIPKTLFLKPRPQSLITVPACRECNEGFSKDEEYFRDRLSAIVGINGEDSVVEMWDKSWRSMQHPKAKGKKIGFFRDTFQLPRAVETKDGPSDIGVLMNKQRINRVVKKMVSGCYFFHFGQPLGEVEIGIDILSSINPSGNRKKLVELVQKAFKNPTWALNFGPHTHVVCGLAEDDRRAGIWVFKLLGQHIVVAIVYPKGYFEKHRIDQE
jgi:hypothetical protein